MNPDTIRDYLKRSEMNDAQAEALSRIFAEMATKHDLAVMEGRLTDMEGRLRVEMTHLKADLQIETQAIRAEMQALRADLTWKMIAIVGFFATASTVLNLFLG